MYINIELKQKNTDLSPITFQILLNELHDALEDCYMDLGTPYNPIGIDNFVTIGENAFSALDKKTKVSISLETDKNDDLSRIKDHKLVCCKVTNVGKKFVKEDGLLSEHWKKIFKPNKHMYAAPDGTLYISPNKNGKCVGVTKKNCEEANVSYSILISLKVKLKGEKPRRFYLLLDPLVKVSSNQGTNILNEAKA